MATRSRTRQRAKGELANEIAQAIRLRAYRPGEWLRQIDMEEALEATRFDVRTALDELAVRKTIVHVPNRGYRVAEVDLATYRAIADTRVILEKAACLAVVARIGPEAIGRLKLLAERFGEAVHGGTRIQQSEINRAFHQLIYNHCGNPVLEETIWALRDRSRGTNVTMWRSHEALLHSDREHREMIAALEARDGEGLAELTARHILRDMEDVAAADQPSMETSQRRGLERIEDL
jgi:DNA-binding GntR family transcriptional regulator